MTRPYRTTHRSIVCLLALVVALSVSPSAFGSVSRTDTIAGVELADSAELQAAAPDLDIPSGLLMTSDGVTLWARDPDAERAMASTTKMMTAIVVLEAEDDLENIVTVTAAATRIGESVAGIKAGERHTIRDLLAAMLVHSGNEAAVALAMHVGNDVEGFAAMMNAKAAELGMDHSHFTNPHGLDEPGHYTSARDLAVLAQYAMQNPVFRQLVGLEEVDIPGPNGPRTIEASNLLLGSYDGANGIKTGWTDDAGYCLVASARRDEVELIAVILGAKSESERFSQAEGLLDWGFEHYRMQDVSTADDEAALVPVSDYLDRTVTAIVASSTTVPVLDLQGEVTSSMDLLSEVEAPVAEGDRLGTLNVRQGERLLAQVPILAAEDVEEPDTWTRITTWITRVWRSLFGGQRQANPVMMM